MSDLIHCGGQTGTHEMDFTKKLRERREAKVYIGPKIRINIWFILGTCDNFVAIDRKDSWNWFKC